MATISKVHKPYNLESHKSLKLSFTNIQGNRPKFVDCQLLLEANSPDIFALCETNMKGSIDSSNFFCERLSSLNSICYTDWTFYFA